MTVIKGSESWPIELILLRGLLGGNPETKGH